MSMDSTTCNASADAGVATGLLDAVDCHIRVYVHDSFAAIVGPNTPFAQVLTVLLTIYVALIGYRLLFGHGGLKVADLPLSVAKIGLVLAFTTSWAAYQTVLFDVLFEGPAHLIASALTPLAREGISGNIYQVIETCYARLTEAASVYGAMASPSANILQGGPMLASGLLWIAAIGLLVLTIGIVLAAKIVLAFLLAIGPGFVAALLFPVSRGLALGWLQACLGFAFVPVIINAAGAAMILLMVPVLGELGVNIRQNVFNMGPVISVLLVVMVSGLVVTLALRAASALAGGLGMAMLGANAGQSAPGSTDRTGADSKWFAPEGAGTNAGNPVPVYGFASGASGSTESWNTSYPSGEGGWREAAGAGPGLRQTSLNDSLLDPVADAALDLDSRLGQAYRRQPRLTS